MNKIIIHKIARLSPQRFLQVTLCLALSVFLSGCFLTEAARDFSRPGGTTPWWCLGPPDLNQQECLAFSLQLDAIEFNARKYPTLGDFQAAGAVNVSADAPADTGEAYSLPGVDNATFNPGLPQALLYNGTTPNAQLVGVLWIINGAEPDGFPGTRDVWIPTGASKWALPAWIMRGYQNHPNVFAASHPCLEPGVTLTSTGDACYLASHPEPLEVLVSNDDGVMAPGIDALVQALDGLLNTDVNVVAPAANQSGVGGAITQPPSVVSGNVTTTSSGRVATEVISTDPEGVETSATPADAVRFALTELLLSPDIVISGVNEGQNLSNVARLFSGTVGAARAGRNAGVPAIATSQGIVTGEITDFPTGVAATLALLEEWRLGRTVNTTTSVLNINIPTCLGGSTPRGTLYTEVKPLIEPGDSYTLQDCASTEPAGNITNDLEAFNHGFIGITDINRTESLTVTSYNVGLALNFVPYTLERQVANEILLGDYESDVICFQEVWLDDSVAAIEAALGGSYPHIYKEPPEQVFSEGAACTLPEITPFADCALLNCPGQTGEPLVSCASSACVVEFLGLSGSCQDGVLGSVGIPNVTVEQVVEVVTQPAGKFAFDGSLGLILASKYELINREFQDFIDDSSGNHRGALYAEVKLNGKNHVVGCTHPTANLEATIPYPVSGNFGSWEAENAFMQTEMINFVNAKAGNKPIFFGGDFNCSIANVVTGADADFAPNCQVWLDDGFTDPAAEVLECTFCDTENLLLIPNGGSDQLLLDHVFVKNLSAPDPNDPIIAERVFDETVFIEGVIPMSELDPNDPPILTHPSDHFGVKLDIPLP